MDKRDEALKLALNVLVNRVDADHEVINAIRECLANVDTNDTLQEPVEKTEKNRHDRKPLTDKEIAHATAAVFMSGSPSLTGIARAIEAAHGIKEKT